MNNREIAAVVWVGAFVLWALSRREVRHATADVVRALIAPKVAGPLLVMVAYVGGLTYVASQAGLWGPSLLGDTTAWFVGTGIGLFGKSISMFKPKGSFRAVVVAALGVTVYVEVFVNLYVFPLGIELMLTPVLAALVAVSVVAGAEEGLAAVKKLTDRLVAAIGAALMIYVAARLVIQWDEFDKQQGLDRVALPVWLTLGMLPFVAVLRLYSNYDTAFSMIRWATPEGPRRWRSRMSLVTGLHLRAREVGDFNGVWAKELVAADSRSEAHAVVQRFRYRSRRSGDAS